MSESTINICPPENSAIRIKIFTMTPKDDGQKKVKAANDIIP
jgi:hypothetical protein